MKIFVLFADEDTQQAGEILKHLELLEKVEFDVISQNDIIASEDVERFFEQHIKDAKVIILMLSIDFDLDFWLEKIPKEKSIFAIYLRHLDKELYFKNIKHTNFTLLNKIPTQTTDNYYSKILQTLKTKLISEASAQNFNDELLLWFF
ncbi:MAG: hypothetical protein ACPG5B_16735 [Chitinophagales bacterium]